MPAQWTGRIVGEIHNAGLTIKEVSAEAGLNPKYVSQILNRESDSPKTERKLRDALSRIITRRDQNTTSEVP